MKFNDLPQDRRRFLRLAAGFSTGALLSGCGGGGGSDDSVPVVSAPVAVVPAAPPSAAVTHPLNLALMLAYLGAQYHAVASRGSGLPATLTGGTGNAGAVTGGRRVTFADPMIAALAVELADEKAAQVATLRTAIGTAVAAQPAIDLSTGTTSAFAIADQRAGIVAGGQAFDPYAGDTAFLLGGFLIEYAVAASYRTLLLTGGDSAATTAASTLLADAIYQGGLIRSLLDHQADANPAIGAALTQVTAMLTAVDGTNVGNQTLSGNGTGANLLDADGRPIPFTRATGQVLNALYLSNGGAGGFLPMGANGVA